MKNKFEQEELPILKAAPLKKEEALFQIKYLLNKQAYKEAVAIVIAYNLDKEYLKSTLSLNESEKISQTLQEYCS